MYQRLGCASQYNQIHNMPPIHSPEEGDTLRPFETQKYPINAAYGNPGYVEDLNPSRHVCGNLGLWHDLATCRQDKTSAKAWCP
jgi:hypothetical protein